jgi:hypothetical protein
MYKSNVNNLKQNLQNVIDEELMKPLEEIDSDLISECVDFIIEIDGKTEECQLTESEIKEAKERLFKHIDLENSNIIKHNKIKRRVIIACAILMSLLIVTVASIAFDWDYSIIKLLTNMDSEEVQHLEDGTIISKVNDPIFNTVEELQIYINDTILYPTYLPEGVELDKINYHESVDKQITISYKSNKIELEYIIRPEVEWFERMKSGDETNMIGDHLCYSTILENELYYIAFVYKNRFYSFECSDCDELILIIKNLN